VHLFHGSWVLRSAFESSEGAAAVRFNLRFKAGSHEILYREANNRMTNIYDAIKEKENQIAIFQAQVSGLQAEIDALRVAARILEGGSVVPSGAPSEVARPVAVPSAANGADKKRVWP
jgi:hypothetical protein